MQVPPTETLKGAYLVCVFIFLVAFSIFNFYLRKLLSAYIDSLLVCIYSTGAN
jgi:hypothetical protein